MGPLPGRKGDSSLDSSLGNTGPRPAVGRGHQGPRWRARPGAGDLCGNLHTGRA